MHRLEWTGDLLLLLGWTGLGATAMLLPIPWDSVTIILGLPLILVGPGYALISALYPEVATGTSPRSHRDGELGPIERVTLSILISVTLVGMVGYGFFLLPLEVTPRPIVATIATITGVGGFVALLRRRRIPPDRRFGVRYDYVGLRVRDHLETVGPDHTDVEPAIRRRHLSNLVLVGLIAVLVVSTAYAMIALPVVEPYTELFLATEDGEGNLTADGLPVTPDQWALTPVYVGIANHEGSDQSYAIVVVIQPIQADSGDPDAMDHREIERVAHTVPNGETEYVAIEPPSLDAAPDADEFRVSFLLYRDTPPSDPQPGDADLHTSIRIRPG